MAYVPTAAESAYKQYWGVIRSAATSHATTADLWSAIRSAAAEAGLDRPGVSATAVSQIRGIAGRMQRAIETLAKSSPDLGITASMIASAPWGRDAATQAAMPVYQVTAPVSITTPSGDVVETHLTTYITGTLPTTVGDLRAQAMGDYELLASTAPADSLYGGILAGVGDIEILAV